MKKLFSNRNSKLYSFGLIALGMLSSLISLSLPLSAQTWSVITTAKASDASASSFFGSDVAIDGDFAVVRAEGSIYIFKRDKLIGTWSQQQKILISSSYNYGVGSVSISGNYIAVVAGSSIDYGFIYVFKRDSISNSWSQKQILRPSDAAGFSGAISMCGNFLVAGAKNESEDVKGVNTLTMAGAAYIFELVSDSWTEQQKIVAPTRIGNSYFGSSVSIAGDNLVIGASGYHSNPTGHVAIYTVGHAYAYKRDRNIDLWNSQGCIFSGSVPTYTAPAEIVTSVCVSCDYIVVGSIISLSYKNVGAFRPETYKYPYYKGVTSIYTQNSIGNWTLKQELTVKEGNEDKIIDGWFFGSSYNLNSVAISENFIFCSHSGLGSYVYNRDSCELWTKMQLISEKSSLSVSGENLAIGVTSENSNAGSVYFYKLDPYAVISSTEINMGSEEGSTVTVDLKYNASFTAKSNQPWLKVNPESINPVYTPDTVSLVLTASANQTSQPRTAKVTVSVTGVSNQYLIVTQAANTATANFELSVPPNYFSIYPNPVTDGFQIKGIEGNATLQISDLNGKIWLSRVISDNEYLPANVLQSGIYLVKVSTTKGDIIKKLFKK